MLNKQAGCPERERLCLSHR